MGIYRLAAGLSRLVVDLAGKVERLSQSTGHNAYAAQRSHAVGTSGGSENCPRVWTRVCLQAVWRMCAGDGGVLHHIHPLCVHRCVGLMGISAWDCIASLSDLAGCTSSPLQQLAVLVWALTYSGPGAFGGPLRDHFGDGCHDGIQRQSADEVRRLLHSQRSGRHPESATRGSAASKRFHESLDLWQAGRPAGSQPWLPHFPGGIWANLRPVYKVAVVAGLTVAIAWKLPTVGILVAVLYLGNTLKQIVAFYIRSVTRLPSRSAKIRAAAGTMTCAIVTTVVLTLIPMPNSEQAQGVIRQQHESILHAPSSGWLVAALADEGDAMRRGQAMYQLDNPRLVANQQQNQFELQQLRTELFGNLLAEPAAISSLQTRHKSKLQDLAVNKTRVQDLTITASQDGTLVQSYLRRQVGRYIPRRRPHCIPCRRQLGCQIASDVGTTRQAENVPSQSY